jgi:hypothetical protein
MPINHGDTGDLRSQLVRQKYFCIRPRPLESWLWSKRIPASAERVFWLHWQEGMQRGDWCSEIPLRRVARECHLDASTVTRAYQVLIRLGCLRRMDPGRDPANPFQQATAVTEILLPRELLLDLNRHPNRRATTEFSDRSPQQSRAPKTPAEKLPSFSTSNPPRPQGNNSQSPSADTLSIPTEESASTFALQRDESSEPRIEADPSTTQPPDPFPGQTGRARLRAISQLLDPMSPQERHAYQDALRLHRAHMEFDAPSSLSAEAQTKILQLLKLLAVPTSQCPPSPQNTAPPSTPRSGKTQTSRKLSLFELCRLRRQLQTTTSPTAAPDLLRQVVWSVEAGSLRRFDTRHALHIALKKIREGLWTRPNRMPPNWARALSELPAPETCRVA